MALDGVVEPKGNWHFPYFNDELGAAVDDTHDTDVFLFGRVTYDCFAGAWPEREEAGERTPGSPGGSATSARSAASRSPLDLTWRKPSSSRVTWSRPSPR